MLELFDETLTDSNLLRASHFPTTLQQHEGPPPPSQQVDQVPAPRPSSSQYRRRCHKRAEVSPEPPGLGSTGSSALLNHLGPPQSPVLLTLQRGATLPSPVKKILGVGKCSTSQLQLSPPSSSAWSPLQLRRPTLAAVPDPVPESSPEFRYPDSDCEYDPDYDPEKDLFCPEYSGYCVSLPEPFTPAALPPESSSPAGPPVPPTAPTSPSDPALPPSSSFPVADPGRPPKSLLRCSWTHGQHLNPLGGAGSRGGWRCPGPPQLGRVGPC